MGERGLKLSGGEKQRVSIARTILKRPPIMVFDRPPPRWTARPSVPYWRRSGSTRNHTSLVIAHRLSTIVDADRIVVLHQGKSSKAAATRTCCSAGSLRRVVAGAAAA